MLTRRVKGGDVDSRASARNACPEGVRSGQKAGAATAGGLFIAFHVPEGKLEAAQKTLTDYRRHKEQKNIRWSAEELYTFARLLEEINAYPEAVRYYYALYNSDGSADSQEKALGAITGILLTAPEEPIRLGSGELSLYRDVATLDNGPGGATVTQLVASFVRHRRSLFAAPEETPPLLD